MECTISLIEDIIDETIANSIDHEWDEDFITMTLMQKFRSNLSEHNVHYPGFSKIVKWSSYKNIGNLENSFGDIALILNIQFSTGELLKGVTFLEAKKQYKGNGFAAVNLPQLQTIHTNAPYSHLLLYSLRKFGVPSKIPYSNEWDSFARATPINTALIKLPQLTPISSLSILRITQPFSFFLVSRFFWGLDLEYRSDAFELATRGRSDLNASKYLGVIDVYYPGQNPTSEPDLPSFWDKI